MLQPSEQIGLRSLDDHAVVAEEVDIEKWRRLAVMSAVAPPASAAVP